MVKTSNFPQLRNSRGSLNFRNKRRAGQNYLVELMVAKREEGGEVKERRKKDKRRVERTMAWNGVDRKMPRFPTLTQVSDRVHFALLTRPFPPRAFHPLFSTSESVEESTQPSRMSGIYVILRVVGVFPLVMNRGLDLISAR